MPLRRPIFSILLALAPLAAVGQQGVEADVSLAPELASAFVDRTPIESPGQPLAEVLRHVSSLSPERIAAAAERQAEDRRNTLSAATGDAAEDFSVTRDLLRFPEPNRGKPVAVRGVVRRNEQVELGGEQAIVVRLVPSDVPNGLVAILLPPGIEPPAPGKRVDTAGLFLKLAELTDGDGEEARTAPLIVAPSVLSEESSGGVLPDRSFWSEVRHRTLGVRSAESGLYYRLLRQASEADPAALRQAAAEQAAERRRAWPKLRSDEPFPVFVDLFQNPQAYEGEAVTLTGYAREIRKYPAGENAEGLETLYEAWVYTEDSQSNPAVVVAADAPPDLPIGEDLQVPVRATGYFFKIYGYEARDTTRVAPMILAGRLEVLPVPRLDGPPWWLVGLLAALFVALLVWLVASYFGTRRRRSAIAGGPSPDFTGIE